MTPPAGNGNVFTAGKILEQKVTGPDLWAIIVSDFTMQTGTILEVEGDNPLAIISLNSIVVQGDIYVNSEVGGRTGPGSGPDMLCEGMQAAKDGKEKGNKGGGGGGAGFGENGRKGGKANNENMSEGAAGKKVTGATPPDEVRGGCPGGDGGVGDGSGEGGGGEGGGAILLSARNDVTVSGGIHAGGAGGGRASAGHSGGGGGGSGGYIALEAPLITLANSAILAANGAGGGAGIETELGADGMDGQLGAITAEGGPSDVDQSAGDGGSGGREGVDAVQGEDAGEGGGGGGAGVGFVVIHFTDAYEPFLAVITPAAEET
jgi:hypothetical protein